MKICIAYARVGDTTAVLRSTPEKVSTKIGKVTSAEIEGEIICSVQGEVSDRYQEDELWKNFVIELTKLGHKEVADDKYALWRRKGGWIWNTGLIDGLYITAVGTDMMILAVPLSEQLVRANQ